MLFRSSTSKENVSRDVSLTFLNWSPPIYMELWAQVLFSLFVSLRNKKSIVSHWRVACTLGRTRACSFCYFENDFNGFPHFVHGPRPKRSGKSSFRVRLTSKFKLPICTYIEWIHWMTNRRRVHAVSDWRLTFKHQTYWSHKTKLFFNFNAVLFKPKK